MIPGDVLMKDTDRMGGVGTYKQGRTIHASVVGILKILNSEEGPCCEVRFFSSTSEERYEQNILTHRFKVRSERRM